MKSLRFIPSFLFLLLIYNVTITWGHLALARPLYHLHLISGATWDATLGDGLLILGVVFMFIELVKATSASMVTVVENSLSFLVFAGFLVEFIVMESAASSVFFILMLMSLADALAGFIITVSTARRDVTIGQ